jgi:RimJ/RimL family protein N-acetyltransferase
VSYVELLGQRRLEVGWQIREQLWGRGFATGIGRAALEFTFDDLNADRVVAFTEAHNSRRVMERLDTHYLQQFQRRGLVAGTTEIRDDALFVLYRSTRPVASRPAPSPAPSRQQPGPGCAGCWAG